MSEEVVYQLKAQVDALLDERQNAVAAGQTTRVEAVDKQLKALGVETEAEKKAKAAEARKAAAETEVPVAPRSAPPVGRSLGVKTEA